MWHLRLKSFSKITCLVALLMGQNGFAQDRKIDVGFSFSPCFAFQSRITPRVSQIKMAPCIGLDVGLPIEFRLNAAKTNYLQLVPSVSVLKNKTVTKPNDVNVSYKFGSYEPRVQMAMYFIQSLQLKDSARLEFSVGTISSYTFAGNYQFSDNIYFNQETQLQQFGQLISSGIGFRSKLFGKNFYNGFFFNYGLVSNKIVEIRLNNLGTTFLDKSSSISFRQIFYF